MAKDLKKGPAKKGKKVTLGKQKLKGKNTLIHGKGKKATLKFNIDCAHPVEDGIMNCGDFEKYLQGAIKVEGKTGNFGKEVSLSNHLFFLHHVFSELSPPHTPHTSISSMLIHICTQETAKSKKRLKVAFCQFLYWTVLRLNNDYDPVMIITTMKANPTRG